MRNDAPIAGFSRVLKVAAAGLWVAVAGQLSSAAAQGGFLGVYGDSAGTQTCIESSMGTLYLWANLEGPSATGITGAEFRIIVTNPTGYLFFYTQPPINTPPPMSPQPDWNPGEGPGGGRPPGGQLVLLGNPIDMTPTIDDAAGMNIAFPWCQVGSGGRVLLGTLSFFGFEAAGTDLVVTRKSLPSNPNVPNALFTLCDAPAYTISPMRTIDTFNGEPVVFRARIVGTNSLVDRTSDPLADAGNGQGVAWGDYDDDADIDLYLSNDGGSPNALFRNEGGGAFANATSGPLGDPGASRGVVWGDYDNDGDLDLYLANYGQANKLFRNDGGGVFADATGGALGDTGNGTGVAWGDYDNDGDLDLYLANYGQANKLFRNDGGGVFADATSGQLGYTGASTGVAWGDCDNDGDLDLYLANHGQPNKLFRNVRNEIVNCGGQTESNHWLHVNLRGSVSNRSGIGARVRVVAGGAIQIQEISGGAGYLSQNSLTAEFGLGTATVVDSLVVRWPFGVQVLTGIAADQILQVTEPVRNAVYIMPTEIVSTDPTDVPIVFDGQDSLGVVSMVCNYDSTKLSFVGIDSRVPGETFIAGVAGGRISVAWIDETGGLDPILPSVDTLFVIQFTHTGAAEDSTQLTFDRAESALGDRFGDPIPRVVWRDTPPYGQVQIHLRLGLSGRVGYYWQDKNVPATQLTLMPSGALQLSDVAGSYQFSGLRLGNYDLLISKNTDPGGINSLDAIKIVRHSVGLEPLTHPDKLTAANVNGDAVINAFDAFKVVRAAVGLENLASGDWKFAPASLSYRPLDTTVTGQNFKAIRMGDVNGDWEPTTGPSLLAGAPELAPALVVPPDGSATTSPQLPTIAGRAHQLTTAPGLSLPDTTVDIAGGSVVLPLRVSDFTGIGAVSLRITYVAGVIEFVSLASAVPGVTFTTNNVGNEIRIEWYDETGGQNPIDIGNATLLTLSFDLIGSAGTTSQLHFQSTSTIGDAAGDPIAGVTFADGLCTLGNPSSAEYHAEFTFVLQAIAPNPFDRETNIRYRIPAAGGVRLAIYNVKGQLVKKLVEAEQQSGAHEVRWDGMDASGRRVQAGVYFVELRSGQKVQTRKVSFGR